MFVLMMPTGVLAQSGQDLVAQLCGPKEAPARNAQQLAEAYQKAIDYLLPLMSADDVGSRYKYQIMLQDMGAHAARPGAESERVAFATVLIKNLEQAKMPDTVQHWFVLQIERTGGKESLPALTKLLSAEDKHLRDYARRALEKNSDPGATNILLSELAKAKESSWKIGLINSLGLRGEGTPVDAIARMLNDSDPKVAAATVTALSNIGGESSVLALFGVFETPLSDLHMKAAQGLIDIAQKLVKAKEYEAAAGIFGALYSGATDMARDSGSPNPFNIRNAAINGLIICDPELGAKEIGNIARDDDPKVRAIAIQAARQAATTAPMQTLCKIFSDLDSACQVQVLGLIADRGDISCVQYAKKALNSADESVRLAAIGTLGAIGADAGAKALLEIAANGSGSMQKAAKATLGVMAGPRVDEVIAAQSTAGESKVRDVAIGLIGKRHMPGAAEKLLAFAGDKDESISTAGFKALIDVADSIDIGTLAKLLAETQNGSARNSGVAALKSALAKATDKDATAGIIVSQMEKSSGAGKIALLTSLDALGGSAALKAATDAANSSDAALREAGIRTLSNWPDFDAAENLLAIASKSDTSLTHYVLAVRGALRLISTNDQAAMDSRMSLCFRAFDIAKRDEEKRQAIAAMGTLPNAKVAEKLLGLVANDKFKVEAGLAAVQLAGNMQSRNRQAARDLAQKIRDMNISDEVNRRADAVISGRRRRR